jgi:hypothetical protein
MQSEARMRPDPTKRGRFNAGEKQVLAMCERATVTSTTGQIQFLPNGKRKETDEVKTEAGTIFEGSIEMTDEEWTEVCKKVQLLIPPITTMFNGEVIMPRLPLRAFEEVLPTEVANERGVLTPRKRKTEVRAYRPQQSPLDVEQNSGPFLGGPGVHNPGNTRAVPTCRPQFSNCVAQPRKVRGRNLNRSRTFEVKQWVTQKHASNAAKSVWTPLVRPASIQPER